MQYKISASRGYYYTYQKHFNRKFNNYNGKFVLIPLYYTKTSKTEICLLIRNVVLPLNTYK